MTRVISPRVWPGDDQLMAQLEVFEDSMQSPFGVATTASFVELPGRGILAGRLARSLSCLEEFSYELGPHGFKLADHEGIDQRRTAATMQADLEALAIAGAGYDGPLEVTVYGPWTLSAVTYLTRGDRALTDRGAVRDIAQSLAAGVPRMIATLQQLMPLAQISVDFDEHLVGQINAGVLPTFSGYSRIPAVTGPDIVELLQPLFSAMSSANVNVSMSIGDSFAGIAPAVLSQAQRVRMDFGSNPVWNERGWELIARAVERGTDFSLAVPAPHISQCAGPDVHGLADVLLIPWQRIGLELRHLERTAITLSDSAALSASAVPSYNVRGSVASLKKAAELIAERAAQ